MRTSQHSSSPALAHGFEGRVDLPVPLWLYLYGAGAAVLLSFVVVGLFVGKEHAPHRYPRFDLLKVRPLRAVFTARLFLFVVRLISVALFLLVLLAGLFGNRSPGYNFAPTFVWIVWWVGFGFFAGFVGNLWPLVNPWKILFEWVEGVARRLGGGLELNEPYPKRWGVWPALAFFFAFVWVELVFAHPDTPLNVALFASSTRLPPGRAWSSSARKRGCATGRRSRSSSASWGGSPRPRRG
jgi:hypothetical protein